MSISSIRGNSVYFGTRSTQSGHSSSELPDTPVPTETSQSATPYVLDFSPIHVSDEEQPPSYEASVNRTGRLANQSPQEDVPQPDVVHLPDTFSRLNTIPLARLAPQVPRQDQIDNIELQELGAVAIPIYEALPAYPGTRQEPQSTDFFSAAAAHKKALAIFSLLLGTVFSSSTWAIASTTMNRSCNPPNMTPTPAPTHEPNPGFPTFPPLIPFPPIPTSTALPTFPPISNPHPTNPLPPHDGTGRPNIPGSTGNAGNAGGSMGGASDNAGHETENGDQAGSASGGAIGNTPSSGAADSASDKNETDTSESEQATSQKPCDTSARNSTEVP